MFRKEWLDIQFPAWSRIAVALLFLLLQIASAREFSLPELALSLYIGFYLCSLWAANYIGLSTFQAEFRDQAFEYLFSFPLSKGGLLLRKLLPRMLLLTLMIALYLLLWNSAGLAADFGRLPFQSPQTYLLWLCFFFLAGFLLSPLDWGSLRPAILPAILITFGILAGILNRCFKLIGLQANREIPAAVIMLIVGLVFFKIFWGRLNALKPGMTGRQGFVVKSKALFPKLNKISFHTATFPFLAREMASSLKSLLFFALATWLLSRISYNFGTGNIDPGEIRTLFFGFMLLSYSFFIGLLTFSREHSDGALEYLLSLPLNRWRLLGEKSLARLIPLLAALLVYLLSATAYLRQADYAGGPLSFMFTPGRLLILFPAMLLLFFACGLFLSLFETKNTNALVSLAVFPPIILLPLVLDKAGSSSIFAPLSGLALVCLILAIFFFRLYPSYDLAAPQLKARAFNFGILAVMSLLSLSAFLYVV